MESLVDRLPLGGLGELAVFALIVLLLIMRYVVKPLIEARTRNGLNLNAEIVAALKALAESQSADEHRKTREAIDHLTAAIERLERSLFNLTESLVAPVGETLQAVERIEVAVARAEDA